MRLLLSYLKQHGKLIAMAMGLAAVNQIFSLLDPQIFRIIVDNYASRAFELSRQEFLSGVILLLLASVGVAFISRVAKNFQDYFVSTITQRVGANLYETSVRHSFSLPYRHFEDQSSGELLQKLQKARTDSQQLLTLFINVIFLSAVGMTFVIAYAFYVNWLVGAVYLLMIPLVGGTMFYLTRRIKATQKEIVTKGAMLAGSTTETLRNVELVKSLGLETQEIGRLNRANESILSLELEKIRLIRILSFVQGTIINGLRAAILLLMMWLIFNKAISFGEFFSLYIYTFFIFNPLQELGNVANAYQETSASMERLEQILNQKPESKPVNALTLGPLEKIEFKNVSFSYGEDSASIKNISLTIPRGQTVAFVGPSGAGKSTLIKLLVSLYQPMSGEILFNNVASNKVNIDNLRQRIGYVSQDTQLFAGTIGENLRFVKPEASEAECLSALKAAAVEKIIERGDLGLETRIGEGGLKLSGGERQRLAIARALLRKPDLIVFDEATSSLDSVTEKEITDTIKKIGKERPELTVVMIAHRLSTISHANTIYVLEKGQVVEEGTHDKLLVRSGLYAALWREQGHKN